MATLTHSVKAPSIGSSTPLLQIVEPVGDAHHLIHLPRLLPKLLDAVRLASPHVVRPAIGRGLRPLHLGLQLGERVGVGLGVGEQRFLKGGQLGGKAVQLQRLRSALRLREGGSRRGECQLFSVLEDK